MCTRREDAAPRIAMPEKVGYAAPFVPVNGLNTGEPLRPSNVEMPRGLCTDKHNEMMHLRRTHDALSLSAVVAC